MRHLPVPWSPEEEVREEAITQAEYEALRNSLRDYRMVLVAKVLRATGLRLRELLRLEARHFSLEGPEYFLLVRRSKKRKRDPDWERVYLPPVLGVELAHYIRGNRIGPADRVFPFTARTVERHFAQASRRIGVKVTPHSLRGLYIKTLLDGGIPAPAAAKMVGHASSKTTEEWYYRLTSEQRRLIQERIPV